MATYPQDKRHLPFGNSAAIQDTNTLDILKRFSVFNALHQADNEFCDAYIGWINSTKYNTISGLDNFKFACYSNGTSEAFDKFYVNNAGRRFRCFKGEYMYHRLVWRNNYPTWRFLEDDTLDENDAVVISLPFSDTGIKHADMDTMLNECSKLGVPVLVDCAYFGICSDIDFNFNHECITDITFSLSKTFPVAHARIGMRLTKVDDDDSLFVYNKSGYINRIGSSLGLCYLKEFSPEYIVDTYKSKQTEFCSALNATVSNTVLFGVGGDEWAEYNRGGPTNRLSLHKFLNLPTTFFYNELQNITR